MEKISNFVLRLCFNNEILPYYHSPVINKLSSAQITPQTAPDYPKAIPTSLAEYDIPSYLEVSLNIEADTVKLKKVPQYKGYLIDLTRFGSVDELLSKTFGRNSRKNFRAKYRKLDEAHKITYAFYFGAIPKPEYDRLFDLCYRLMHDRFREKKIFNRFLPEWKWYYQLFYPKILRKEASIFVIYDEQKPITMTLNFHRADIVFSFIQIYDTDYSRYSMGDIAMYKNLEWCYNNQFTVWDTSKGATDNKERWSNHVYTFDHHIFYNTEDRLAALRTGLKAAIMEFKQWLRDKGVIGGVLQLDRIYYYTRKRQLKNAHWSEEN